MSKRLWIVAGIVATLVLFFGLAAIFSEISRAYHHSIAVVAIKHPPYVHSGNDVPVPKIHAGDLYFLKLDLEMKNDCTVETQNRIELRQANMSNTIPQNGPVMYNYALVKGLINTGPREVNEIFETPHALPPGRYAHVRTSMFSCSGFSWATVYPDALFDIIAS